MKSIQVNINNKINYIKEKITYKRVLKWLVILATLIIAYNSLTKMAYASSFLSYGNGDDPFGSITKGWGQFVADKYRNNYYLDILNLSTFEWMDKGFNWIVNAMFSLIVLMAWFGINIFRFCFTNDIASAFSSTLENVMNSLNNGVFNSFFMIVFMISLFSVVYQLWKKNYSAIAGQLIAVSIIFALSGVFSNGAVKFLSASTEFSKMIGTQAILSITGTGQEQDSISENNLENYSKQVVGTLWGNFVHQPWIMLEFDGKLSLVKKDDSSIINNETEQYSQEILSNPEGSSERDSVLENIREKYGDDLFSEDSLGDKFVSLLMLLAITAIKMVILIAIGMIQIGFQLFSILLVLLVPFILLVAIVPFFGGVNLIKELGKRFLGTQFGIIISSFVIALLIFIDNVTLTMFQSWGANLIIALLMQCTCWIMLIGFRKKLFSGLNSLQNKIASGTANPLKVGEKVLDKSVDTSNKYVTDPVMTTAADVKNNIVTKASDAKDSLKAQTAYAKSNLSLYKDKKLAQAIDFFGTKYDDFKNKYNADSNLSDIDPENADTLNTQNNINKKPTERIDLNGVVAKNPIENKAQNENNSSDKNIDNANMDDEIISKDEIDNPTKNESNNTKDNEIGVIDTSKNNGIDISNNTPGTQQLKDNKAQNDDEITTKPENLNKAEKTINKVPLDTEKVKETNKNAIKSESQNSTEDLTEVVKDGEIRNKSNSKANTVKNEKIQQSKTLEADTTSENLVTKKVQTRKINNSIDKSNLKVNKKVSETVSSKDRVEKLKSFLGVTEEQITKKENLINKNLKKTNKNKKGK